MLASLLTSAYARPHHAFQVVNKQEADVAAADAPPAKYPPNRRLAWQRLQRGWSRDELVTQIKRSMTDQGEPEPGLNTEGVRRWENGQRWPEPRYRKHLVLVFNLTAAELGLLLPDELALCPDEHVPVERNRSGYVNATMVEAVARKVMLVVEDRRSALNRNLSLAGLLGASLAPLQHHDLPLPADTDALVREQRSRLDPLAVTAYAEITTVHRDLYWRTPAQELLPSVAAHAQLGVGLLRATTSANTTTRRLAAAVAESALLTARLAFFDLAQMSLADEAFDLAQDAVEVAQDHALSAVILAHRAFVPGFAGHAGPAHEYLRAAQAHARYDAGPLLRSWLHCVEAEIDARTSQPQASLTRIRAAEDALTSSGNDPVWLDFFSEARLDGFAGNALLLAGNHKAAAPRLQHALDGLGDGQTKQRAVLLFDLAVAQAPSDAARALATAQHACELLSGDGYAAAVQRIPAVRTALGATPYVAELDAQVRELTGATGTSES